MNFRGAKLLGASFFDANLTGTLAKKFGLYMKRVSLKCKITVEVVDISPSIARNPMRRKSM